MCDCVNVCHMCVSKEVRPMASDALELEFQAVVSLPPNVGTEG